MDEDFLDLLEQAFLVGQIDGATMDATYELMRAVDGFFDRSIGGWPTQSQGRLVAH